MGYLRNTKLDMRWLRSLIYYRTLKGLETRITNLGELIDIANDESDRIYRQLEKLELEEPKPEKSIALLREEIDTYTRLRTESLFRRDEVEGIVGLILKDWNRR